MLFSKCFFEHKGMKYLLKIVREFKLEYFHKTTFKSFMTEADII